MYLERTLNVKNALSAQHHLVEEIKNVLDGNPSKPLYACGSSRSVYEIGDLELPEGTIPILLKVGMAMYRSFFSLEEVMEDWGDGATNRYWQWSLGELGLFDLYQEYLEGKKDKVEYLCSEHQALFPVNIKKTMCQPIEPGDLGVIPYFHMIAQNKTDFGILTEGLPCLVKPRNPSVTIGSEHEMENGRIIDLFPNGNTLLKKSAYDQCDHFGLWERGKKYFSPEYRLEV